VRWELARSQNMEGLARPLGFDYERWMSNADVLDRLLDPVSRCFDDAGARALIALRADARAQSRIDELAAKCNEGLLTPDEREEYEACVQAAEMIAILQAKARLHLKRAGSAM
jgi:hypothetical protein